MALQSTWPEASHFPHAKIHPRVARRPRQRSIQTRTATDVTGTPDGFVIPGEDGETISGGIAIGDVLHVLSQSDPAVQESMRASVFGYDPGSLAESVRRMLALRQDNTRSVYDTWNSSGQPTHGYVLVYDSKADLEGDSAPWALATGKYEFDVTYDGSLRITSYPSTRET